MTQAEFVASAVSKNDFPREGIPEVVFAGRSNVGKSSLINRLAGDRKLARISSTPGKTRSVSFYRINRSFFFVDLPGYGYAKTARSEARRWKDLVEQYFLERPWIALVIQLIDSRMPPAESDLQFAAWIERLKIPRLTAATKWDKVPSSQKSSQERLLAERFRDDRVILVSAKTGAGCREIWKEVLKATSGRG